MPSSKLLALLLAAASLPCALGQSSDAPIFPAATGTQTETDEYTRYELLDPASASFRIYYEVTATTAGAAFFYNPIRKGSIATDESVTDAMTGKPLHFQVVHGADAAHDPLMAGASADTDYIKITLARPVPQHGQARLIILKTYKDPRSYFADSAPGAGPAAIVFNRPLGIRRNKIVLPAGYELTGCSVPAQVLTQPDGRIAIAFMHAGAGESPLLLHATRTAQAGPAAAPHPLTRAKSWEFPFQGLPERARLDERAHQDRDIVYFLQQPETHAFALFHDYTESRPGINAYANVVREGSKASNPSAYILDTGEVLPTRLMTGAEMIAAKYNAGEEVDPKASVVVIPFTTIRDGESIRLRISETYTAPVSYRLDPATNGLSEELVFDRSLGRPRNAVVLPSGWYVTASATPATVSRLPDNRIRLDFLADAPEAADVLLKARRRPDARATPK